MEKQTEKNRENGATQRFIALSLRDQNTCMKVCVQVHGEYTGKFSSLAETGRPYS